MISVDTLYEYFLDTLESLSTKLLAKSDDDIDYLIHEALPPDVVTYLHEENVMKLVDAGLLSKSLCDEIQTIRSGADKLLVHTWEPSEIRSDDRWKSLRTTVDDVLTRLTKQSGS